MNNFLCVRKVNIRQPARWGSSFNFRKFGSILPQFSGGNNNFLDRSLYLEGATWPMSQINNVHIIYFDEGKLFIFDFL